MKDEKKFLKPVACIIEFNINDIIVTSGEADPEWMGGDKDIGGGTGGDVPH